MSNINDHRVDITGQDWSGAFRADGDYVAWRHVEPIVEANRAILEALEVLCNFKRDCPCEVSNEELAAWDKARAAIAKAKGATP